MKSSWIILAFFITFAALNSYAMEIETQVSQIEVSEHVYGPSLIFLTSGHVAKVFPGNNEMIQDLSHAKQDQNWLKITLSDEREITHIEFIAAPFKINSRNYTSSDKSITTELPSVLSSMNLARKIFNYARYKDKESQCFNRAHIWSYEWKADNNVNTAKMFLFFSVKYIRENNFQWWFHVAPYVHVVIGTDIKERIMDKKYTEGPSSVREWVGKFLADGTECRTVNIFSDFVNYPESGDCYLMRSSMYTYWPLDLEMEELNGSMKKNWVPEEIHQAYIDALDVTI